MRGAAYGMFMGALFLVTAWCVFEIFSYYQEVETYRRLYVYPARLEITLWLILIGLGVAVVTQLAAWRTRQVSKLAVAVVAALSCFDIANFTLDLNPACCGQKWPGFFLQFWF